MHINKNSLHYDPFDSASCKRGKTLWTHLRWMYPFERFMKVLNSYVRNRNRSEGCIVECYIAEEAIEFCTEYLSNVDAIGIPIGPRIDHKIGTPLPRRFVMKVDPITLLQAHHYVFENTTIVQPSIV